MRSSQRTQSQGLGPWPCRLPPRRDARISAPNLPFHTISGSGNGPFGFGWSLSLPTISRKTDRGLPQYQDAEESDVYLLSGAEDLVPTLVETAAGNWERESLPTRTVDGLTYRVTRYRPRIDRLFARIERWSNVQDTTDLSWRSISADGITTWYGKTAESRVFDPSDPSRIFAWLICESHDDKGNVVAYGYKPEDSRRIFEGPHGKTLVKAHERNRTTSSRSAQRYLKRIRYGNRTPYFPVLHEDKPWPEPVDAAAEDGSAAWLFEVVLDYGEHHPSAPMPTDDAQWPARNDPFSSFRAGFEVRTYRTCHRVLMFHHFDGEGDVGRNCLVRSTDFTYAAAVEPTTAVRPAYTFLRAVTQTGYRRAKDGYASSTLPPVEFEYSEPNVQRTVEVVPPAAIKNLPVGLDDHSYRWIDLHGEGLPGILTEQDGTWLYKRNLGAMQRASEAPGGQQKSALPNFGPLETVANKPSIAIANGAELMDLDGDGFQDVVVMSGPTPGLFKHDNSEGWQSFRPYRSILTFNVRDPNARLVDLDGDGRADFLATGDDALMWAASLGEDGFGPIRNVPLGFDEETSPRVVFTDSTQSLYLADMSGDGLADIVRIRHDEVCYWPSMGYGRFGAKVTMDNSPHLDSSDYFDPRRVRLADIDGSGTSDIIYLHRDGVRIHFNQSGNGWSDCEHLNTFPRIDDFANVVSIDLLGNGTACLVWSSPHIDDASRPMQFVNLMGEGKPHLLVRVFNNLGAETQIDYASSTKFYLLDKSHGRPWITRLPMPVHVVERVTTFDHISRNRFVTRYAYHHGYFDGKEREFRGFGMVEQWDTDELAALSDGRSPAHNVAPESNLPPVHTKTWFHTGAFLRRDRISNIFAGLLNATDHGEYFREPGLTDADAQALLLQDTMCPMASAQRMRERHAER